MILMDEYFTIKLEIFGLIVRDCKYDLLVISIFSDSPLYMWCLDVKCFERSLSGQADASFFTFGQFCRFLRKLCSRAVLPKCIPGDMDWTGMLYLCPDDLKLLSCRDFLHRLKLVTDIDLVCKAKIRQSRNDPNISANEFGGLLVAERIILRRKPEGTSSFCSRQYFVTSILQLTLSTAWLALIPTLWFPCQWSK